MPDCAELETLNRLTFAAENRGSDGKIGDEPWDVFLGRVLADDFVLRRSNAAKPDDDRATLVRAIRDGEPAERRVLADEARSWCSDTLGVVTCPVEMMRGADVHRYQNVKVFTRRPGEEWRCVYWQVTEAPPR
jgi:hypothetical protein